MRYLFLCVAVLLWACHEPPSTTSVEPDLNDKTGQTKFQSVPNEIVARIDGHDILLSDVDAPIRLGLYDMEWQAYQLRRESLKRLAAKSGGRVEIFLEPPVPPRLNVKLGNRPIRGVSDAPVLLTVFCSFQSSHCARLQPVLEQLRKDYGEHLALAYFDFPQAYHRNGLDAAIAARCGSEDKVNWAFYDSLFGIYDDLNFDRFSRLAVQTGVTPNRFKACYDEKRYEQDVRDDVDYARSLGFGNVPVVLVNGLYVKGPKTAPAYQYYIDQELSRLEVRAITADNVENVSLPAETSEDEKYVPQGLGYDRVRDLSNLPLRDKSEVTLSRNWVNGHLADESEITAYFYKGNHAPEGNHVLKLADVEGHDFFETMGFREGDVILQVNGQWVHENQNNLWNELRYSGRVEVKLMRRGKPVTYYYRFGD